MIIHDFNISKNAVLNIINISKFFTSDFRFSGAPGAPGKPEIVDYDEKSVQLKFNAPENDGGAPLLKYVVQKKDR